MLEVAHMDGVAWFKTATFDWQQLSLGTLLSVDDCIRTEEEAMLQLSKDGRPFMQIGGGQTVLLTSDLLHCSEHYEAAVNALSLRALGFYAVTGAPLLKMMLFMFLLYPAVLTIGS
jgi:hypothetical protein